MARRRSSSSTGRLRSGRLYFFTKQVADLSCMLDATTVCAMSICRESFWIQRRSGKRESTSMCPAKLIIKEMIKMHSIKPQDGAVTSPCLFRLMDKYLSIVPDKFEDEEKQQRYIKTVPSHDQLRKEVGDLKSALTCLEMPIVFCHNDNLLANIIFNEQKGKISFIDYEYAAFNYQAYDIGNHFCEFAGVEEVDYNLYPNKEFQMKWLQEFLTAQNEANSVEKKVTERDVESLYVIVNKFALASHMFWGIWALVQSHHSTIDFDFLEYSKLRLDEYLRRKDAFLALTLPQ
ncbi:ethanolamine kinase 1-like isoform X3 [Patiria miniata]|uniref:ethanolamine kinase n=1 Tax=Patiria miniata TaxID=46514 RepID=A0A914B5U6_PATMI|nr:ethanolamine kinase 1-like isoform X3 [Patiria miniata]